MKNTLKNKTFEESSKSRGVFRTHASIYNGTFLWIYFTALYFCSISSIMIFDWVIYRLLKILRFSKWSKVEQIIAIVATHSVSCYILRGEVLKNGRIFLDKCLPCYIVVDTFVNPGVFLVMSTWKLIDQGLCSKF